MWKGLIEEYKQFLPVTDKTPALTLNEGNTPLIHLVNLSKELGIELYGKIEGANPTGSFKDRGMVFAVAKAIEDGSKCVICASTGNTSAAGIFLSFFNLGAWGALYAYTPEQYPMVIRGTGAGMAAAVGRIGGIFGPLLVGSLLKAGYEIGNIFAIFCVAILVGVASVLFLGKETKQTELE